MTENILSQEEVDALLKGVDSGEIETETMPSADGDIRKYDFTAQDRIVRGRMPGLEMASDKFARIFRDSLASSIMKFVSVNLEGIETVTFSEFMKLIPLPSSINMFKMHPLKGYALFVAEAPMVFAMVDYFFGGAATKPYTKSEGKYFTPIEQRVIRRVVDLALKDLGIVWRGIGEIKPEYVGHEMNPQFVNIVTPTEGVIKIEFLIEIEEFKGRVFFCIPYSMVEPVKDKLFTGIKMAEFEKDKRWVSQLMEILIHSHVNIAAELGVIELSVGDLMNLEVGDIITLGRSEYDDIDIKVQDVPKFCAKPGISRSCKAVKITKLL